MRGSGGGRRASVDGECREERARGQNADQWQIHGGDPSVGGPSTPHPESEWLRGGDVLIALGKALERRRGRFAAWGHAACKGLQDLAPGLRPSQAGWVPSPGDEDVAAPFHRGSVQDWPRRKDC
jgi:hypothetical protein